MSYLLKPIYVPLVAFCYVFSIPLSGETIDQLDNNCGDKFSFCRLYDFNGEPKGVYSSPYNRIWENELENDLSFYCNEDHRLKVYYNEAGTDEWYPDANLNDAYYSSSYDEPGGYAYHCKYSLRDAVVMGLTYPFGSNRNWNAGLSTNHTISILEHRDRSWDNGKEILAFLECGEICDWRDKDKIEWELFEVGPRLSHSVNDWYNWDGKQSSTPVINPPPTNNNGGASIRGYLESPSEGSNESGIGVVRGWVCDAEIVEIQIDNRQRAQVGYGTTRGDTFEGCGDTDNGFGYTFNWNLLNSGQHNLRVFADGVEFANVRFNTANLGSNFLRNASGQYDLDNFPTTGQATTVRWSEAHQNFVIVNAANDSQQQPSTNLYGALAYDEYNGANGYSYGYTDENSAISAALDSCSQRGSNCIIATTFYNKCAALADSPTLYYWWATNNSQSTAEAIAIENCNEASDTACNLEISICTNQ